MTDHLERYGWDDRWSTRFADARDLPQVAAAEGVHPGRVVRHDGAGMMVAVADDVVRSMFGPAVVPPPVVGDWIVLDRNETPLATLPRDSLLRRRAAGKEDREQAMAANVDLVLVVCGLDRPVRSGRIQRTITIALDAGAESLVVLTKADKVGPLVAVEAEEVAHEVDPDLEVVTLSAKGGWGVEDLRARIGDRTVALIGESGAGKSTLVNALLEGDVALEGDVRAGDAKGRHTTTHRELHLLPGGGVLVDTPGIREVGIWTDTEAVADAFADIDELAEGCRFRDCTHGSEPGCAVLGAVADGTLAQDRLDAWRALDAEAASAELRADVVERRRKARQFGRMARDAQKAKEDLRER